MGERAYGDIILKYPQLIEDGLTFEGREVNVFGRRIDLLFKDKYNRKLIVELKVVRINDTHVGQILDYYSALSNEGARLMFVSPDIPLLKRSTFNNLGIEWKELTFGFIEDFLRLENDEHFLNIFEEPAPLPAIINNNADIQSTAEAIRTPFENDIFHFGDGLSEINFYDRYNIEAPQNINIVTSTANARIYLRIEERIHNCHPNYFAYTCRNNERSWGFGSSYQQRHETINSFIQRLFWVHFTKREPRRMQLDIHNRYIGHFRNTNIPQNPNNFQDWEGVGRWLIIRDYLSENTIDEIMDIIVEINF